MQNTTGNYSELDLETYITNLDIKDKNAAVFKAYKIALNKNRDTILSIIEDIEEREQTIFINSIAYRIAMELADEMKDTGYKVQGILERSLGVEHNTSI